VTLSIYTCTIILYINILYISFFFLIKVTISQTYKNVEKDTIEAQYKFPINESAAVCGFEAEIDGRKIKGVVKEAKEAAKSYTEAVEVRYLNIIISYMCNLI
jgi:hypothetical protein